MTNSYNSSAEYLNKMRQELASKKSAGSALISTTPEYVLPVTEASSISDVVTATSAVIGTYKLVNNTHLIAHLPLQLDTYDAMNSNHGTVTGTEQYTDGPRISPRKLTKMFLCNGSNCIQLANESNFDRDITNGFSITGFFQLSSTAHHMLVAKGTAVDSATGFYLWYRSATGFEFQLRTSTPQTNFVRATTTGVGSINRIYHIGATYAGGGSPNRNLMKIYVDGTLDNTGSAQAMTGSCLNSELLTLFAESDLGLKSPSGCIGCDAQFWDVELTAAEMAVLASGNQINRDSGATDPAVIGMSDMT